MYYQGEVEFTPTFRALAGVRGDLYRFVVHSNRVQNAGTDTAGLLSPKFGVIFAPARRLELYGNFGYGYHSNDARGVTLTVDPLTGEPAPRLTPLVRTRGGELGIRTILVPKLQTTLAVWGLTLASELVFVGDAGTTEAGRPSRRTGVEWANYYSPRPWLTLDADFSWSSAQFTDRDPAGAAIPGAVGAVASVGASLQETHRMSGGLRVRHLGPRPLIETGAIRSHRSTLVDVEGGYRVAPKARVVVDALNLFDSRASDIEYYYRSRLLGEAADGMDDIHTHPLQPRTVRVGVRLEF
jgi:TonB dependent receptor